MNTVLKIENFLKENFEVVYEIKPFDKAKILQALRENEVEIVSFQIDVDKFEQYLLDTDLIYTESYKKVFGQYFKRKALEHFCSFELLGLTPEVVYMDVASSGSNVPVVLEKHYLLQNVWRQDITYPEGVNKKGRIIGSNAANIPVENSSFDKIALHCSFEHFEKGADIGFIEELGRILKKGGKACILPLYMNESHHIMSNLELMLKRGIPGFDKETPVYLQDRPNNHYGRFYDPASLKERIINTADRVGLKAEVIDVEFTNSANYGIGTNLALILTKL